MTYNSKLCFTILCHVACTVFHPSSRLPHTLLSFPYATGFFILPALHFRRDCVRPPSCSAVTRNSPLGLKLVSASVAVRWGLGVVRTSLFLVFGWFNFWQRHAAAALSAVWAWSLPVCACVYSLCVLREGNLITCVCDSTEKVFCLLFFRVLHWLLSISKFICSLTLLGEMRPPVSASTGIVSAVVRRTRRVIEEEVSGPSRGGKS